MARVELGGEPPSPFSLLHRFLKRSGKAQGLFLTICPELMQVPAAAGTLRLVDHVVL